MRFRLFQFARTLCISLQFSTVTVLPTLVNMYFLIRHLLIFLCSIRRDSPCGCLPKRATARVAPTTDISIPAKTDNFFPRLPQYASLFCIS